MPHECLAADARVVSGRDGQLALALDAQRCASCVGCFWRSPERIPCPARLLDGHAVEPGRRIVVRLPVATAVMAALVLYGMPLVGLLAGALLGASIGGRGDLEAVIGAGAGFTAALCALRLARTGLERQFRDRLSVSVVD